MGEHWLLLFRLGGDQVRVERYQCQLQAWSSFRASEEGVKEAVLRLDPLMVVWGRSDQRAAVLGRSASGHRFAVAEGVENGRPRWVELPGSVSEASLRQLLASLPRAAPTPPEEGLPALPEAGAPSAPVPIAQPAAQLRRRAAPDLAAMLAAALEARARRRASVPGARP